MPIRLIEVVAKSGHADTLEAIARQFNALDCRIATPDETGIQSVRILAHSDKQQELVDQLQGALGAEAGWRLIILPVDAIIPDPEPQEDARRTATATLREQLYVEVSRGARADATFVLLVLLSTVVAAIGLFNNNVAVVIAAMVIAPLLGPNEALAFGSALGDRELIIRAALTNALGLGLAIAAAAFAGYLLPERFSGPELIARTQIGYDSIILALAAGAAGAISLTTSVSSAVVGVMVAVALMPPAVALGYMLGTWRVDMALSAGTLLAINIVCINLTAQIVFLIRGIRPRTWYERRGAKQSTLVSLIVWTTLLAVLLVIVYLIRHSAGGVAIPL
ncbi:TIGR00341 family protein [Parvibaculum sedimenti]|uniref:TIGR00341 family protein n=1 Tax=Parvibaculum sedimenti TaxID=2608632 RepID=UPI00163AB95B|nr:TIGR00341 family protein [Parvibaculum sedimenti]